MTKTFKIRSIDDFMAGISTTPQETLVRKDAGRKDSMCDQAWNYLQFFPQRKAVGYCCRTSPVEMTDEQFIEKGSDLFFNTPHVVERRKNMLAGIRDKQCDTCWRIENNGLESKRTTFNMIPVLRQTYPEIPHNSTLASDLPWDTYHRSDHTRIIEVILGNTCDAKCVYCTDYFSSQWAAENKKFGDPNYVTFDHAFDSVHVEAFWQYYEKAYKSAEFINFIGGEPLIIKDIFRYLDRIIEIFEADPEAHTLPRKELSVVTNGNTPPDLLTRFFEKAEKLSKYFNVAVMISGENTEEQLEYVRNGTKWSQWKENVERYMSNPLIEVRFLPAVQLASIPSFYKYLEFILELYQTTKVPCKLHWATVSWPSEFNLEFIPLEMLEPIDKALNVLSQIIAAKRANGLGTQTMHDEHFKESLTKVKMLCLKQNRSMLDNKEWAKEFVKFFDRIDYRRGSDWTKTFPEFAKLKSI